MIKPSKDIESFLKFVEQCKKLYSFEYENVGAEDKKTQTFLHDIEKTSTAKERSKIATQLHKSRIARRESKDMVLLTEKINEFFSDKQHQFTLNKLSQLLGEQRKVENYVYGNREFKNRVDY